jgi:hypothetical protein
MRQVSGDPGTRPVTFIDWSDSEGMFGLLLDFVADKRAECEEDPERQRFLSNLLAQLRTLEARLAGIPASVVVQRLKETYESVGPEFAGDPIMAHLQDCIEELERVENGAAKPACTGRPAPPVRRRTVMPTER